MENISAQLEKILDGLGDSADQVAKTLKAKGIQGNRNTVRILNPIVRFVAGSLLISNLGMDVMVPDTFRIHLLDGAMVETPLPQAIRDFLAAFNQGAYSEMEMPSLNSPAVEP